MITTNRKRITMGPRAYLTARGRELAYARLTRRGWAVERYNVMDGVGTTYCLVVRPTRSQPTR